MTAEPDHYRLLGIDPKASAREIKRAWLKLARREHPDVNPGDREAPSRYARLQEAYRVLSQRPLREEYDRRGRQAGPPRPEPTRVRGGTGGTSRWEQVVRELFPEAAAIEAAAAPVRGEDVYQVLEATFEQALRGTVLESRYQREVTCPDCRGRRWAPAAAVESCRACGGRGVVEVPHGPWTVRRLCPACDGERETGTPRCRSCRGKGRLPVAERREVRVPAGSASGSRIVVSGGGQAGRRGGDPGDLIVTLRVHAHPVLERRGRNLHATIPVPLAQAILGGPVHVPTAEGRSTLRLPPGTQCGQQFTLRGKGVPAPEGGGRGDLLVTVSVAIPSGEEPRVRRIAQELEKAAAEAAREKP
ncbi:MAG TPA: J domain-containing protein [Candidatus Methanoperedens sp.]|nr:J domain-containing protein [Candidatus Methanoperedens sp.]